MKTNQTYKCNYCGKECKCSTNKLNKYCSNSCQGLFKKHKILNEWLNGNYYNKKGNPPDVAKNWISEQQNHKCLICDISEWNGKPITFQFDHIDGNPDNNTKENIRMLCPNCHSQTDTFGVKNKKSKHSQRNIYRRKNYRDNALNANPPQGV